MFEFSIVSKYLIPHRKHLSVSIISLISITVISLVVWLIVVFFSVTHGLEQVWTNKLITLTAPIRITPTEKYYQSYYHLIDQWSHQSNFASQTIQEKRDFFKSNPYDPEIDQDLPHDFPAPDLDDQGNVKDLVGILYSAIHSIQTPPDFHIEDFETTFSEINLQLTRQLKGIETTSSLKQPVFLTTFSSTNDALSQTILPFRAEDFQNIFLSLNNENSNDLRTFLEHVQITSFQTPPEDWQIPSHLLKNASFSSPALLHKQNRIVLFPHEKARQQWLHKHAEDQSLLIKGTVHFNQNKAFWQEGNQLSHTSTLPLFLAEKTPVQGSLLTNPISQQVSITIPFEKGSIQGTVPSHSLQIYEANSISSSPSPFWISRKEDAWVLPENTAWGDGILLPRAFRDAGARIGDQGFFKYYAPGATSVQEQQLPVFIAGFYDPGIIPLGGKWALANHDTISLIRSSQQTENHPLSNGIYLRFSSYSEAEKIKQQLQNALAIQGLTPYWNIETFREYDFAKELIQQLNSEKNLFSVLALVIILVACSNIISMLIILVNDKKTEIGVLRSLGATSYSMILIFSSCGLLMGTIGSIIGTLLGILTLKNLNAIIHALSALQGHEMFQSAIYGEHLPNHLSIQAILFVFIATTITSLLAGLVPAAKACRIRPAAILKQE